MIIRMIQYIESSGVTVKPVPDYLKQRQGKLGDNKPPSKQKRAKDERSKRKLEMSLDPLDPANSSKHMRGPKPFGALPVPVVYLHDVTVDNPQQDWTISPCISSWVKPEGYESAQSS